MFTKDYWRSSSEKLRDIKYLTLMALFIAMKVVAGFISIKVSENLFVSFSFIFTAVEAAIFGPVAAIVSAFVTDIVSFLLDSKGYAFFPGYTLSAMLASFIYAIFLYRQKITIWRIAVAKFLVNYLVNVTIGSIWSMMIMSKGYIYYFTQSIIKNTILLPFEIIVLVLLFNLLIPYLEKHNWIIKQNPLPLKWK